MSARKLVALRPDLLTEAQLSGLVVELARIGGWKRYHTFNSKRSSYGFPDWVFARDSGPTGERAPRLVFAELKSQQGKVRPEQQAWLDALSDMPGVEVYVWRPADFDEIAEVLTGRKVRKEHAA